MLPTTSETLPAQKKPTVVAVCTPFGDMLHPATFRSIMRLDKSACDGVHLLDVREHPVEMARNEIVGRMFTIPAITHLLWVDDDMVFEPDALARLLARDLPIVGGLCHNRRHPYMPILLHKLPTSSGKHRYSYQYEYPEGLVKVDATGAAFILVKREVYEAIENHPDFQTPGEGPYSNLGNGEDTAFCERAAKCGFDTYVDTTVKIGHIGEIVVDETFARRNRMSEVTPWVPPGKGVPEGVPVATVVIPTYNQNPEWLHAAVKSAVAQSVPVEIIVVDNGSDGCIWCGKTHAPTSSACPGAFCLDGKVNPYPHLRVLRIEKNAGSPWAALNLGIREMKTDYFTWLSSDDLFHPRKIERQLRYMHATDAVASYHGYEMRGKDGTGNLIPVVTWRDVTEQRRILSQGCVINGLTVMLHRSVFEVVGTFHETPEFSIVADWEFWNRVGTQFLWQPMQENLATRRDYGNASERYANDPEKHARWLAEDDRVRAAYTPRVCAACAEVMLAAKNLHAS